MNGRGGKRDNLKSIAGDGSEIKEQEVQIGKQTTLQLRDTISK